MAEVHLIKKPSKDFFLLPFEIYKSNPFWVPPLLISQKEQFSDKNPFFKHSEIACFLARKNGKTVGRIVSILNRNHINFHNEKAGFFGFFECIEDFDVARLLLDEAKNWLKEKGMEIIRGPANFSTNEECGMLIDSFDSRPKLMMPYNPQYYPEFMERYGLGKAKDLYAYNVKIPERLPEKVGRAAEIAQRRGITVRPLNIKRFMAELRLFKNLYNYAWEKNWGFVPMTDAEIDHKAKDLKSIIVPELTFIAETGEEPVGFLLLLPDFNEVLCRLNGRLFPFGIFRALWYSRRIRDLRLILLGVKEGYRRQGVDALLFREGFIKSRDYYNVEFSWILEDNYPVQRLIDMIGGKLYKRYRMYEAKI